MGHIFRLWDYFSFVADAAESPAERLMRVPKALEAYVSTSLTEAAGEVERTCASALAVPSVLTACGYRDQVYLSGCISLLSNVVKHGGTDSAFCASSLSNIVGGATDDLTDARAKIAVRDGLPVAVCQLALACIKDHISQEELGSFVDFAVRTLRALVSYGDRVSGKRGGFRPNTVTQAILQHEAVKTMRAAGQQPKGRRKGHQQQQIAVPKEAGNDPHMAAHTGRVDVNLCVVCQLLELFDEIESAANERADALLAAELGISDTQQKGKDTNTNTSSKGGKKKSKAKKGGEGANSTKQAASSSSGGGTIDTPEDHSEPHEENMKEHRHGHLPGPPSPSPLSPPRPSCSSSAPMPSAVSGGPSGSVRGGGGRQQGVGDGGGEGDGFVTVGRSKRGTRGGNRAPQGGHAQQQQTDKADKPNDSSSVFPCSSSSESTRPSSSHSSVCGGLSNAPPQPPARPSPTRAPTSSFASDEGGSALLAARGGSSSSTLQMAVDKEGRGGQERCGEDISELEALRQQLEAMRMQNEAILKEKEDIKRENDRLQEERESTECDICMAEKKNTVLIPCRHFCLCGGCAAALMRRPVGQRLCTRCRQAITATKHVYL